MLYSSLGLGGFGFCLGLVHLVLFTFPVGHRLVYSDFFIVIPDRLDRFAEALDGDARFVNL